MGLIEKLENFINKILIFIGDLIQRVFDKIIPEPVKLLYRKFKAGLVYLIGLPKLMITSAPEFFKKVKASVQKYDVSSKLKATYQSAVEQYAKNKPEAKLTGLKHALLAPFLMLGQWLQGLSAGQTLLLLGFSAASVLAGINIVFSGNRILSQHRYESRAPASIEDEFAYERPAYYKKQSRHLDLTSVRLPVYFPNVNELRSIDIDFTATLSNRLARLKLEKLEFQLRDHLVLNMEPMMASFPLEDEGKEIIRQKLLLELNDFLIHHKIEGEVSDLKLTYILAN